MQGVAFEADPEAGVVLLDDQVDAASVVAGLVVGLR